MGLAGLADEALASDEPWDALVEFIERGSEFQAENRALRELVLSSAGGADFARRARETMRPKVAELVRRAQESGELRADIEASDMPLIQIMIATVMDFTADVAPDTWRRMLWIVLDGLRAARGEPSELPAPPLDPERVARGDGELEGPRVSAKPLESGVFGVFAWTFVLPIAVAQRAPARDRSRVRGRPRAIFDPRRRPRRVASRSRAVQRRSSSSRCRRCRCPSAAASPRSTLRRLGGRG